MPLTSPQNPLLQKLRRAVESGRPLEDGTLAAEGPHLLAEALASAWGIEQILCSSEVMGRHRALLLDASSRGVEITEVATRAFKSLSDTEHHQGLVTLVRPREFVWADVLRDSGPVVILDGIQDPGNAGAILRSTEAFGGAGAIFAEGCVRISNGKLLRAAAGSLFRLPYLENCAPAAILSQTAAADRTVYSLAASGHVSLDGLTFVRPFALVVGSEGSGVSALFRSASQELSIPTRGVESLNAAIACSVTLFEAARQIGFRP